ncbi:MAG TPA: hypothetical protein VK616_05710 [Flavitalea sp.]|nr:hypothetical protein [Flavitalea sp.]HTF27292.1 hypothetical protein [Flavitalea sp.]
MNKRNIISTLIFSTYVLLAFYVFGGGMVTSLVTYRTWKWIGANEFPKFHQSDNAHIIPVFVIFFFLSFIPQILLFWFRPSMIPKWMIWLALFFNLSMLISSITIQIPIQMELDNRFSMELIERLISTDLTFRVIPMILLATTNFIMLYKVVKSSNSMTQPHYKM